MNQHFIKDNDQSYKCSEQRNTITHIDPYNDDRYMPCNNYSTVGLSHQIKSNINCDEYIISVSLEFCSYLLKM